MKIAANSVFAAQILLIFLLLTEQRWEAPAALQAFGRLHPLLLHMPIGFLVLAALLLLLRRYFESPSFNTLVGFLMHLSALTASFTALMGLILAQEGGYADDALQWHKWLGAAMSMLTWLLLLIPLHTRAFSTAMAAALVLLVLTGHYGASLTHGENFVLAPLQATEPKVRVITDSSTVYDAAIDPLLEAKCYGCHNASKAKGKLVLTSLDDVLKGGKHGALWEAGNSEKSLLIQRLLLPTDDDEHMPPKDKAQLTPDEIRFLSQWVNRGADVAKTLREYDVADTLRSMAATISQRYQPAASNTPRYTFAFAPAEKIAALSNPYRAVFPIAQKEPALQADFFVRQAFKKEHLDELGQVGEQIVSLNLTNMPVGDGELKSIAQFKNLEVLNLNNTGISAKGLAMLQSLPRLRSLSLSGTKLDAAGLQVLENFPALKKIYVWNTGLGEQDLIALKSRLPKLQWETGYVPDKTEVLQLSPPLIVNADQVLQANETIALRATLPGTIIRYTTDGSEPDSLKAPVYEKPLPFQGYATIRARAYREGWKSSEVMESVFFRKGFKPAKAVLQRPADKRYPGRGAFALVDGQKGVPEGFSDPAWMAFRQDPLEAVFYFGQEIPTVRSVTVSYAKNIGAMSMPPQEVEVWGGPDEHNLTLLGKSKPVQPQQWESNRVEGAVVAIPPSDLACYKIVAKPLAKLPAFRKAGATDKGWLIVDEIFFN